jgi:hypothetical protein
VQYKHALLKSDNEVLTYFLHFSSDMDGARDVPATLMGEFEFRNNFLSESYVLRGVNQFLSILSTLTVRFGRYSE